MVGRLCDFLHLIQIFLKRYFPKTVAANLIRIYQSIFVETKVQNFIFLARYLFTLKEARTIGKIIWPGYLKELKKKCQRSRTCLLHYAYPIRTKALFSSLAVKKISRIGGFFYREATFKYKLRIIVHNLTFGSIKVAEHCGYLFGKKH